MLIEPADIELWYAKAADLSVIVLRGLWATDKRASNAQILRFDLQEILTDVPATNDAELIGYAADLAETVTHDDDALGLMTLDRSLNCFSGAVSWNETEIGISVDQENDAPNADALAGTQSFWKNFETSDKRLRNYAAEAMVDLVNDWQADAGESPITSDQFEQRLTPQSLGVDGEGRFTVYYDDVFWGHVVIVTGTLTDGPTNAFKGGVTVSA